jgi:hypothetical protein
MSAISRSDMRCVFRMLLLAWAVALFVSRSVEAAAPPPALYSEVVSAEVQGLVFYSDGKTPASDLPVRIWDFETREFIYESYTDQNGFFALPKLEPGKYYVTFDWMKLELVVVEKGAELAQQPHDIVVIIPRGVGFMSVGQLNSLLLASTISQMAVQWERPKVVSP